LLLIVTEQDQDATAKSQAGIAAYSVAVMQSKGTSHCPLPVLLRKISVVS
jgi:hypothetical protein